MLSRLLDSTGWLGAWLLTQGSIGLWNFEYMSQDIFRKIVEIKEKQKEKRNEELRDRVRYEVKDTLKFFERQEARGYTTKESLREIEKSIKRSGQQ